MYLLNCMFNLASQDHRKGCGTLKNGWSPGKVARVILTQSALCPDMKEDCVLI